MTDNDLMPFGKYQGQKMANVPARYLKYLLDEGIVSVHSRRKVFRYIEDNIDSIEFEIEREAQQRGQ